MEKNQLFDSKETDLTNYMPSLLFTSADCDFNIYSTSIKSIDSNGKKGGLQWWVWILIILAIIIV